MKKFKAINLLIVMLTLLVSLCFAVGCNNNPSSSNNSSSAQNSNSSVEEGEDHISFNSFTVQGNNVYGTVSNATEVFEFANEITAGKTCEYVVSLDEFGFQTSLTKAVPLAIGNNTFYIFEIVNGAPKNTFVVTIRRKPIYTVTFNSNCGTAIQSQTVEEGYLASTPTEQITKLGYTFTGWDFDFTAPITQSITIDAKFEVKPEMANFNFTSNLSTCEITGLKDKSVTQVLIPDYVTSIGSYAFYDCDSLTSVEIGDSVTSIGYDAFEDCDSLTSVEIGDSVTSIGSSAFEDCDSLTSVVIGDGVTFIGYEAFYSCDSLTSVVIGDSVTSIGDEAFRYCYKLVEVINKSSHITVTKDSSSNGGVGYYALSVSNCDNTYVSKLTNDNGYIIYTDGAEKVLVDYTGTETALTLPSYVTKINQYAFYECESLMSVVIGDSVTSIGFCAFGGCSSLQSITIPFVGAEAGKTSSDTYQYPFGYIFGTSSYTGGTATEQWYYGSSISYTTYSTYYIPTSLKQVTVTGGNILYGAFYNCSSLTSIEIPDSVTSIGEGAFSYCDSLTSVEIPDSVTSIGDDAFSHCSSLTSVVIGDSVTSIGDESFYRCDSLTSVVIGDSVTSIGSSAFEYCYKLVEVINKSSHITVTKDSTSNGYVGWYALSVSNCDNTYVSKLTNDNGYIIYIDGAEKVLIGYTGTETALTLPSYVTTINIYAFEDCDSLTSVVIGASVTSIGYGAFEDCDSLTSIKYRGTQSQWNAISKGRYWDYSTGDYTITYNYTGE